MVGTGYQPTASKDLAMMFRAVSEYEPDFYKRTFVDIGAGKGKVMVKWASLLSKYGMSQRILGIELDSNLVQKARKRVPDGTAVIEADATRYDYASLDNRLLLWIFNPFNVSAFADMLYQLRGVDALMVMNNPTHVEHCLLKGMPVPVLRYRGEHRNSWFVVRHV